VYFDLKVNAMHDVFLSYSRKDTEFMQRARDVMRIAKLNVWTDENLQPGTPAWHAAIGDAIESSQSIVVLLSPDAKISKWVSKEISHADIHGLRIFPILVRGDDKTSIPFHLNDVQHVDARSDFVAGMQLLLSALNDYLAIKQERDSEQEAPTEPLPPDRHAQRKEFWKQLLAHSREKTPLFSRISSSSDYWISTGAGKTGLTYIYQLYEDKGHIEFYIDVEDWDKNKAIFDRLYTERDKIETTFGAPLEWQRLDDKRASRIRKTIDEFGGRNAPDQWAKLQEAMIDSMIRLDTALRPVLKQL
jgi:hypothetical protein